jgi:outer membrane protein TolC
LIRFAATAAILTLTPPARAEVVTLSAVEEQALHDRPALAADAARGRAADAGVDLAKSTYNPTLDLRAQSNLSPGRQLIDFMGYKVSGTRPLDDSDAFNAQLRYGVDLTLSANLYDFGRTAAALQAARAQRASADAKQEATREAILKAVRVAYLGWLTASELHAIAERGAADARARLSKVQALVQEGVRPSADLSPAESEAMLAQLEVERARGELSGARLSLEQATGAKLPADAEPDLELLKASAATIDSPEDDAALRALQSQRTAVQASARAKDRADAPVLGGQVLAGVNGQNDTVFPNYGVGVSFKMPLWDGGSASADARVERAKAEELAANIAAHTQEREKQAERARLDAENATRRLQAASALLEVCRTRLTEAQEAYDLGAGGLELVGRARAMLRRAETEVLMARVARAETALRLR